MAGHFSKYAPSFVYKLEMFSNQENGFIFARNKLNKNNFIRAVNDCFN